MKPYSFYSDKKIFTKCWVKGEWFVNHVFCSNHYENRYYVVDNFGNLIQVAYNYLVYPYTCTIRHPFSYRLPHKFHLE